MLAVGAENHGRCNSISDILAPSLRGFERRARKTTSNKEDRMIQGPVSGGKHGWAFGHPLFDLKAHGYVEAEYFLSGTATTYGKASGASWGRDGRWSAEAKETVPFKTRMLIY